MSLDEKWREKRRTIHGTKKYNYLASYYNVIFIKIHFLSWIYCIIIYFGFCGDREEIVWRNNYSSLLRCHVIITLSSSCKSGNKILSSCWWLIKKILYEWIRNKIPSKRHDGTTTGSFVRKYYTHDNYREPVSPREFRASDSIPQATCACTFYCEPKNEKKAIRHRNYSVRIHGRKRNPTLLRTKIYKNKEAISHLVPIKIYFHKETKRKKMFISMTDVRSLSSLLIVAIVAITSVVGGTSTTNRKLSKKAPPSPPLMTKCPSSML